MQKIMFNDRYGLTQAVLEGRKTMMRRVVKQNLIDFYNHKETKIYSGGLPHFLYEKSHYKIGEVVAIAQSYSEIYEELKRTHGSSSSVTRDFFHKYIQGGRMPVSNKMFVKAKAMPHQIRITDIKVENLQEISDEDCLKEGVAKLQQEAPCDGFFIRDESHYSNLCYNTPREAFAALIDKVYGKGTWDSNPYVFVYEFELV